MRPFAPIIFAFTTLLSLAPLSGTTAQMPLSEVRPGMTGVGLTVFEGTKREEFGVRILGILENVMGPRRSIIVAHLEGGPLKETGVIQGMSGSPVYIDDRLVGAVAYALGSFAKEPIAGITPIAEMIEADRAPDHRARHQGIPLQLPVTQDSLRTLVRDAFRRVRPFADQPSDVRAFGLEPVEAGRLGTLLHPIATPIALSGFVSEIHNLWASAFNGGGFVTTIAGRTVLQDNADELLRPGDAVGASLVRGDLSMAGTGTVTMVDNSRVYAFGHPFYNLGPVNFPMTRVSVTTVLPSLAISSKIAAIGEVLGTIDQDRSTGVFGTLGPGPRLIPVRISLESADRDLRQTFEFEVVEDTLFTPLLTYTGILNTLFSWTRQIGATTYIIDGTAHLQDHADITVNDIYTGTTAPIGAATAFMAPLSTLFENDFERIVLEAIDITIVSIEEPRTATLERVWFDVDHPKAGDTVPLKVLTRSYRGATRVETVMVDLPEYAVGSLEILVADATQLTQRERQKGLSLRNAENLDQMIKALNDMRRNNRLYVKLLSPAAGAIVRGKTLPSLPPSVLAVLEGDRRSGGLVRLRQATLGEWQIQTDYVVSGSRLLTIDVEGG